MNINLLISLILLVVFISTILRSAFGFGNALIAMPLLILLLDLKTATPLVALLGLITAAMMLIREWRQLEIRDTAYLLLASLAGIPLGLLLLVYVPEEIVRWFLGFILIGFGAWNLIGLNLPRWEADWLALAFGLISGVLGGAYNANGPPIVIYGLLRGWTKEKFRATLQGYFLLSSALVAVGHGLSGLWNSQVFYYFILSIPAVVLGVLLGARLTARASADHFRWALDAFLILLGILMFI